MHQLQVQQGVHQRCQAIFSISQPCCLGFERLRLPPRCMHCAPMHAAAQEAPARVPFQPEIPLASRPLPTSSAVSITPAEPQEQPPLPGACGSIQLIMGAMFAGKTNELLKRVRIEQEKGLRVLLLKSHKDTRYTADHISSHSGERLPCKEASSLMQVREDWAAEYKEADVIGIDESQFFADLTEFVTRAADEDGKSVIVAGLDGDFQRRKFGQLLDLVPMADDVVKLQGICICGRTAAFSLRIAASEAQELVGGSDSYRPVCRRCYLEAQLKARQACL